AGPTRRTYTVTGRGAAGGRLDAPATTRASIRLARSLKRQVQLGVRFGDHRCGGAAVLEADEAGLGNGDALGASRRDRDLRRELLALELHLHLGGALVFQHQRGGRVLLEL